MLDRFRLAAAVLVVCIHTSPLATDPPLGDLWLTRILARVAVPFFLMVSGACLARQNWRTLGRFWKRTLVLYLCAAAAYLPLNWYSGTLPRTLGCGSCWRTAPSTPSGTFRRCCWGCWWPGGFIAWVCLRR